MALDPYLIVIMLAMLPTIEALGAIAVGILVFAVNMGIIFLHLIRPKIEPLVWQPRMARSQ